MGKSADDESMAVPREGFTRGPLPERVSGGGKTMKISREGSLVSATQQKDIVRVPWALVRLPPFPLVATKVLQLVSKDDSSLRQFSALMSTDQAFSSEILTIANSPLYPIRTPVTSILQGIAALGLERVKALAVTVGVRVYLGDALRNPSLQAIWRHSLACALLAEEYSGQSPMDKGIAYTAGIMHDIGRAALVVLHPGRYESFLQSVQEEPLESLQQERELFEIDHCEAGRHLAVDWKLPNQFPNIISEHHSAPEAGGRCALLAAIRFSCRMADTVGFAAAPSLKCRSYKEITSTLPGRVRDLLPHEPEELAFRIAAKINSIESVY
jgi:putative nucleotidyltransferase with HDIG domain